MIRDFAQFALELHGRAATTDEQAELCTTMFRRPVVDRDRFARVWGKVEALSGTYEMPT